MRHFTTIAAFVAIVLGLAVPRATLANSTQVLISHGLVSQDVGEGADLFFRGTFGGNGRTCGTCHPADNNQTIEPEFIASLPSDDPLFIAEKPESEGGVPGLEIPDLMRRFGLILENADGFEDPTEKFVMRATAHSLSLATSIEAETGFPQPQATGWGGDGSPDGTLLDFSTGATIQHFTQTLERNAGDDFVLPTDAELDKMEKFMLAVGRLNELDLPNVTLADAGADVGRQIFLNSGGDASIGAGKCNNCHANGGANVAFGDQTNRNFDTGVEEVPHPGRDVVDFPGDGGLGKELNSEGTFGDGTFNTTPLVEAADTGPFFHNHVIETLEEAVAFYSSTFFNDSPAAELTGPIALTPGESDQVAAALRVINAAFNLAISDQRNSAGITLENSSNDCDGGGTIASVGTQATEDGECLESPDGIDGGNGKRETVNTLLALSNAEAADAIEVLSVQGLHGSAVTLIKSGIDKNQQAMLETGSKKRKTLMKDALADFRQAKSELGTGLDFVLGEGNLLF